MESLKAFWKTYPKSFCKLSSLEVDGEIITLGALPTRVLNKDQKSLLLDVLRRVCAEAK